MKALKEANRVSRSLSVKASLFLAGIVLIMVGLASAHQDQYAPAASLARAAQPLPPAPEPQPQPPTRKKQLPESS